MANRKTGQEIEKCFKQVNIGVEAFDEQYRKYEQSTNASQRDKLVDNIKRECKKLQRLRDQIKTWAAGNDVKDKGPLQEKRELIETKMEAFKAVEKEMKTKAFSKEGLTAAAKLDPKDKEKAEVRDFLDEMTAELGRQVESIEAEIEQLQGQVKKSKRDVGKAERISELEETVERHKWHQGKLELLIRALDNDNIEAEEIKNIEDGIKDYVDNNQEVDFVEDEYMYEDFNLDEAEEQYGMTKDLDKATSHDDASPEESVVERVVTSEAPPPKSAKAKSPADAVGGGSTRRPSQQIKSPLPALADMGKMPTIPAPPPPSNMRPAPPPSLPSGAPLKYASAAAVAVANDKAGIGIAPLPPPPSGAAGATPAVAATSIPQRATASAKASAANSPAVQPASLHAVASAAAAAAAAVSSSSSASLTDKAATTSKSPVPSTASVSVPSPVVSASQPSQAREETTAAAGPQSTSMDEARGSKSPRSVAAQDHDRHEEQTNGAASSVSISEPDEESVYHLPASLQELVDTLDATRSAALPPLHPEHQRQLMLSMSNHPDTMDAEKPRHYKPANASLYTPPHFPQVPLAIFDDARLYNKIDTDSLFYSFYYRQNTYQQYLAAKALKGQSWRFHKQYQTWFQRHEEPKHITEDFEQGTYRFFDYESTWMNRRKADFKFAYKYLEDDL